MLYNDSWCGTLIITSICRSCIWLELRVIATNLIFQQEIDCWSLIIWWLNIDIPFIFFNSKPLFSIYLFLLLLLFLWLFDGIYIYFFSFFFYDDELIFVCFLILFIFGTRWSDFYFSLWLDLSFLGIIWIFQRRGCYVSIPFWFVYLFLF